MKGLKILLKQEVADIEKRLTAKEKEFCSCFLNTGDVFLSAQRAGYGDKARRMGEKLICKKEIADEIERLALQREKPLQIWRHWDISGWLSAIFQTRCRCCIWKIRQGRI